jgi:hypothetical protein
LNPKNLKKDTKKKNTLGMDLANLVERILDVDENMKEVNISSLHHMEEKEMKKIFHIKIQVKKTKIDALFNSSSHANIIVDDFFIMLGLEVHDNPSPYPLVWVNKDTYIKVTKQCNIKFFISAYFID